MSQIPSLPQRAFTVAAGRRNDMATAYQSDAQSYDRIRPGYPSQSLDFVLRDNPHTAVDIGCGSGIFTEQLVARGLEVYAVDPSQDMLDVLEQRLPTVKTCRAGAEDTGLAANSVELITCAQAWHWVDPQAASSEAARLLTDDGCLVLLWNQLDVEVPWVHRLARIMHAGDVHRPEHLPPLGNEFGVPEQGLWHWGMGLSLDEVIELTKSRSYYRKASQSTRAKVEANLRWYWCEHLRHGAEEKVEVPYLTHAWRARKRPGK